MVKHKEHDNHREQHKGQQKDKQGTLLEPGDEGNAKAQYDSNHANTPGGSSRRLKGAAMRLFISFVVGLVFGTGLYVSGMTQPSKVQGFLDIFGHWDPSLAFVMAGAVAVGLVAFSIARRRSRTFLGDELRLPPLSNIDAPLVVGSLIFGVGWGPSGICPGPSIVDVGFFNLPALVFVVSMAAGMVIERLVVTVPAAKPAATKSPVGQDA